MKIITDNSAKLSSQKPQLSDPLFPLIYRELEKFAALLSLQGIQVGLVSPASMIAWSKKTETEKKSIISSFSNYRHICSERHLAGVSLRDNITLVSHVLERAGLFAPVDVRSFLKQENMVEIYRLDSVQIYRSINFFDYCNYTLLDLLTREWFVLYERLSSVTDALFQRIQDTVQGKDLRPFEVPTHIMKERDANPRGVFEIEHRYCCPLFDSLGQPAAFLASLDVKELDLLQPDEERFTFLR